MDRSWREQIRQKWEFAKKNPMPFAWLTGLWLAYQLIWDWIVGNLNQVIIDKWGAFNPTLQEFLWKAEWLFPVVLALISTVFIWRTAYHIGQKSGMSTQSASLSEGPKDVQPPGEIVVRKGHPSIVFEEPFVQKFPLTKPTYSFYGGHSILEMPVHWARVMVRNDPPKVLEESTAENATVTLEFFGPDGKSLFGTIPGRWADNAQIFNEKSSTPIHELNRFTLMPTAETTKIDIALKHEEDLNPYGFNFISMRDFEDWKNPERKLPAGDITVKLILRAINLENPVEKWYVLRSLGEKRGLEIRENSLPASPKRDATPT